MRIAIADDEADIRQYFRRLLPRLGHDVVGEAANGRELVELCRREHPDLVITDIMMPEMDGIEAASEIAKSENIPIIIVSSHDPPEDKGHATIVAFLVKPISIHDLQAAISKAQHAA
jgi:CheY-like chemotaxis protein